MMGAIAMSAAQGDRSTALWRVITRLHLWQKHLGTGGGQESDSSSHAGLPHTCVVLVSGVLTSECSSAGAVLHLAEYRRTDRIWVGAMGESKHRRSRCATMAHLLLTHPLDQLLVFHLAFCPLRSQSVMPEEGRALL